MDGVNELAGDGGPPHDPGMEARVAVLEEIAASTKQAVAAFRQEVQDLRSETSRRDDALRDAVESDFRILFGAIITVALGLATLMAKGFHWF
jgi:phosphate uptake regulator